MKRKIAENDSTLANRKLRTDSGFIESDRVLHVVDCIVLYIRMQRVHWSERLYLQLALFCIKKNFLSCFVDCVKLCYTHSE